MREPPFVPLPGKTNVTMVSENLEEIIQGGYWEANDKLPTEVELCKKYNVGRSTVREALKMLRAKGMIRTVQGQGTFINARPRCGETMLPIHLLNPESEMDLLNVMELRLSLEPLNALFAARRATDAQVRAMRTALLRASAHANQPVFAAEDFAFHMRIAEATGNPIICTVMDTVHTFLKEQQIITARNCRRRKTALRFHTLVLEAIEAGNGPLAEEMMRKHMNETYDYVTSLIAISRQRSERRKNDKQRLILQ